jgi:hypothetical protein
VKMTVAIHCGTVLGRVRASYAGFFFYIIINVHVGVNLFYESLN